MLVQNCYLAVSLGLQPKKPRYEHAQDICQTKQIAIVLDHYLQRYSLFCVLSSILSHLMTSLLPNLPKTKILIISGTR